MRFVIWGMLSLLIVTCDCARITEARAHGHHHRHEYLQPSVPVEQPKVEQVNNITSMIQNRTSSTTKPVELYIIEDEEDKTHRQNDMMKNMGPGRLGENQRRQYLTQQWLNERNPSNKPTF
jgi:hypothetical protein